MSVPNIGPEHPELSDLEDRPRGGNGALVYRDDMPTDDVQAASTRASAVSHRFGGVRHALSRPGLPISPSDEATPGDGGGSDPS
jgi:hypothetical protein